MFDPGLQSISPNCFFKPALGTPSKDPHLFLKIFAQLEPAPERKKASQEIVLPLEAWTGIFPLILKGITFLL